MNYVMHVCRDEKCNNGWIDKDLTNVKTFPPAWKYCQECCIKRGIVFDKQKTSDYLTAEEIEKRKVKSKKASEGRLKKRSLTSYRHPDFMS